MSDSASSPLSSLSISALVFAPPIPPSFFPAAEKLTWRDIARESCNARVVLEKLAPAADVEPSVVVEETGFWDSSRARKNSERSSYSV